MAKRRNNGEGSVYKVDNSYRGYIWVTTPAGRRSRKYVQAKTRTEALRKLDKLRTQAIHGPVATSVPTVAGYLQLWLDEVVRPTLAPTTALNYDLFVRRYIVPALGAKKLDRLTVRDVQTWVNAMRTTCQCCAQGKDQARPRPRCCSLGRCCEQIAKDWTIRQAWAVLRSALAQAVREEVISRNVAGMVRMPIPRLDKRQIWTVADVRQFLESSREADDSLHAAYVVMLVLGLRRGELLGLGWDDINLDRGEARIGWQIQRIDGKLVRRRTKTAGSDAVLPLPEICLDALRSHRALTNRRRLQAGEAWHETGLVFTTLFGLPLDPRNFNRSFKARSEAAEVLVIPVHSTRRTCASLLVELGVHPRVAMAIMRHSQISVTMNIYSQVTSDSARAALADLGSRLATGGQK
jgi:integrase